MKKLILVTMVLVVLGAALIAANPWKARLDIINKTGENVYIRMRYPYTWLTARYTDGQTTKTRFTIERDIYQDVEITACGVTAVGTMNLERNLRLTFTSCDQMFHSDKPQYLGEPGFEKPNWFRTPGMAGWQFKYILPTTPIPSNSN